MSWGMYGSRSATAEVYNLLGWLTELTGKNMFDI
jgi:hypothetical protein